MDLNTTFPILEPSDWLPGMQFTYMFSPQQFTAPTPDSVCGLRQREYFWLHVTEYLAQSCLNYNC